MENPYQILGIQKDANIEVIKSAYKRRAFETHPDRPGGSKEKFLLVNKAYQILSDEHQRKQYDEYQKADWRYVNYQKSLDELLAYLTQEAYALILHGKSTVEIHRWLATQGCPESIIIQLEQTLRKKAIEDTTKEGLRLAITHLILFGLSIAIVVLLRKYKPIAWVGILISIIFFFTYWPRAIQNIVIGFASAMFGSHPLSWSASTFKIIGYSPLIILILFYFYPYLSTNGVFQENTKITNTTNRWMISKPDRECFEISHKMTNKFKKMKIAKQHDELGVVIYTDNGNIHYPVFKDLKSCKKVLYELNTRKVNLFKETP